jgi:hypothetical protein
MNKRGSLQDILMIAIILFVLAVVILIAYKVHHEINNEFQESGKFTQQGIDSMDKIESLFPGVIDNVYLVLAVGLAIVAIVLAALVRIHPIFIIFYLLVLVSLIFFCGIFSNVYSEIAAQSEITALADNLTFISHLMSYLPFIVGIFGSILAVAMYKLWAVEQ